MKEYYQDCIILGGGVCGVWIDAILQKAGYSTCLLEKNAIGGDQTLLSQGILHKGMKYLLGNWVPEIANNLLQSAQLWEDSLKGKGAVNLSETEIYASKQIVWNAPSFFSSFFTKSAQKTFYSQIEKIKKEEIPAWFQAPPKNIFWLKEKVINSHSMMQNFFVKQKHYYQCHLQKGNYQILKKNQLVGLKLKDICLWTKKIILAAGSGNRSLAQEMGIPCATQLRPLEMLCLEHSSKIKIYGHCITNSTKPLFTISSHPKKNGKMLWYLGGKIAEDFSKKDEKKEEHKWKIAEKILTENIKVDLKNKKWTSIKIDRAEPLQKTKILPEKPFIEEKGHSILCFPVKLAFAPLVALEVKKIMQKKNILPEFSQKKITELPLAKLEKPFYEK